MDYNVYCDESCHLEYDHHPVMVLGGIWCPTDRVRSISRDIKEIKIKHNACGETKWVKVSQSKEDYYFALIDYFFRTNDLHFRCTVVENKDRLDHSQFNKGSHDTFYYKMYYYLLRHILSENCQFNVYIDIKDTRSQQKIDVLKEILSNQCRCISCCAINKIQHIRSHESEILQLADLFIGVISYANRKISSSQAKTTLVNRIAECSGFDLIKSTPCWESKFNVFVFSPLR